MSRYRAFIILILDVLTIFFCNFLTMLPYLLGQDIRLLNLVLHIGMLTVCVLLFQLCLKTYDTLWRYAESQEYLTLLEGMGLGFALYSVVNLLLGTSRIWISSALTGTALALLVMLGYRFVYRSYRRRVTGVGGGPRAGAAGKSAHRDVPARQDRARDGRRRVDRLGALPPDRGEPAGAARDPRRGGEHDL